MLLFKFNRYYCQTFQLLLSHVAIEFLTQFKREVAREVGEQKTKAVQRKVGVGSTDMTRRERDNRERERCVVS